MRGRKCIQGARKLAAPPLQSSSSGSSTRGNGSAAAASLLSKESSCVVLMLASGSRLNERSIRGHEQQATVDDDLRPRRASHRWHYEGDQQAKDNADRACEKETQLAMRMRRDERRASPEGSFTDRCKLFAVGADKVMVDSVAEERAQVNPSCLACSGQPKTKLCI